MWPFQASWWWGKRISQLEEDMMSQQQDASDLKTFLDAIAGSVAPIQAGINALEANLAAAVADDNPDLLKGALEEARQLKETFGTMAAHFAAAGSPIPETSNPAPVSADPPPSTEGQPPTTQGNEQTSGEGTQTGEGGGASS